MKRNTQTMDGNMAAAYVSYAFTEAAAVYPITPSSPMAEYTEKMGGKGKEKCVWTCSAHPADAVGSRGGRCPSWDIAGRSSWDDVYGIPGASFDGTKSI